SLRWAYRLTMARVLCPSTSAISCKLAPFMARYDAAVCRRSWKWKFSTPARLTAPCHDDRILAGRVPVGCGHTNEGPIPLTLACWRVKARAWPVNGTARRSPFLVSWKVSVLRFRSISDQYSESSSPLLAPVERARITIG